MAFPRRTALVWGLLLLASAGCSPPPTPPDLPDELASFDPAVATMLREAHEAILADPNDAALWYDLGMGYQANELFERSQQCYEAAVATDDTHAKSWYQLGQVRKRNGDLDGAIKAVDRCGDLIEYAPAFWRAGEWRLEQGDLESAAAAYARAIEVDPADVAGPIGKARVELERGEAERAVESLTAVLQRYPGDPEAHLLLGTAQRQLGNEALARFHLAYGQGEPIIRYDEWSSELTLYRVAFNDKLQLSNQYLAAGQIEIATEMLQYLRMEKPDHLRTLATLSQAYRLADRPEDALEVLEEADRLHPDNYTVLIEFVPVFAMLGREAHALQTADRCIELQPDRAIAWGRRGLILQSRGDVDEALVAFDRAVELDASNHAWLQARGDAEARLERWDDAEGSYAAALALKTRDPDLYVRYGFAAFQNENYPTAAEALERALLMGPKRPDNVAQLLERVRNAGDIVPILSEAVPAG